MKYANRLAIVATIAMSAAAAQAAGFDFTSGNYPPQIEAQSTLTRAEVNTQVMDAMAKGEILSGDSSYLPLFAQAQNSSSLSREQVRQETAAANKAGLLDSYGE